MTVKQVEKSALALSLVEKKWIAVAEGRIDAFECGKEKAIPYSKIRAEFAKKK